MTLAEETEEVKKVLFKPDIDAAQERTKPRLVTLIFCHYLNQDKEGRNLIAGGFDRLFVDPKTNDTGKFIIFLRTAETRQGEVILSIIDPTDKVAANLTFGVPEEVAEVDSPLHVQFAANVGFKIKMEGPYWVDVSYNGKSLGGAALKMEYREQEGEEDERGD